MIKLPRTLSLLLAGLFFLFHAPLQGQDSLMIRQEKKLRDELTQLRAKCDDSTRIRLNDRFRESLLETLALSESASHPFDSLLMGRVTSDDGQVRIFTWNIQLTNGSNLYTGIVQEPEKGRITLLPTRESAPQLDDQQVLQVPEWPGGLVYRIIKRKEVPFYTLMLWDGFSLRASRKYLDIFSFDANGNIQFGAPVFSTKKGILNRVVFEYTATAAMTLNYTYQEIRVNDGKRTSTLKDNIIVADQLVSGREGLENVPWAQMPVGFTYDGFVFRNGMWRFVESIEVSNPAAPKRDLPATNQPSRPVSYDLFEK